MEIQDFLIVAVQNIQTLIKETDRRVANTAKAAREGLTQVYTGFKSLFKLFGFHIDLKIRKSVLWAL